METLFARVAFSERDNFINYLANDPAYKNKIAFLEGTNDIPAEIWTNGKKYADTTLNQLSIEQLVLDAITNNPWLITQVLLSNQLDFASKQDVHDIIHSYLDSNGDNEIDNLDTWDDYLPSGEGEWE